MRLIFLSLLVLVMLPAGQAHARDIILFAAASTTQVMNDIGKSWNADRKDRIRLVYGSSGALARQIEAGAPADIFFSANAKWVDHLTAANHAVNDTRRTIFRNRIVLITPTANRTPSPFNPRSDIIPSLARDGRLAIGDPQHVPAGIYGRQALSGLGLWGQLVHRTVRTQNVRLALALVQRREALLGIVYYTDAIQAGQVRIVMTFNGALHDPIHYDAIATRTAAPGAAAVLAYLKSGEAEKIYRKYGFLTR
jgi:molybdate transport system substrate-binding protein